MFCNVLDLESCVFLVSPYKHNANTVLNFIIETGFRNPGIRNPEITRVYNSSEKYTFYKIGIRNPEITRVYNRWRKNFLYHVGIRNPEITRVYNHRRYTLFFRGGIRNPEITRVYNERDSMDRIEERYTQPGNNQGL